MNPHVSVVTVGVRDLEVTYAFYVSRLGWTPLQYVPDEVLFFQVNHGLVLSFFRADHLAAEAGPVGDIREAPFTLGHNLGSPAEVDAVLGEAAAAGGTITAPGTQMSWGGYSGYFTDPDGVRWEACHNPGLSVDDDGRVTLAAPDPAVLDREAPAPEGRDAERKPDPEAAVKAALEASAVNGPQG